MCEGWRFMHCGQAEWFLYVRKDKLMPENSFWIVIATLGSLATCISATGMSPRALFQVHHGNLFYYIQYTSKMYNIYMCKKMCISCIKIEIKKKWNISSFVCSVWHVITFPLKEMSLGYFYSSQTRAMYVRVSNAFIHFFLRIPSACIF